MIQPHDFRPPLVAILRGMVAAEAVDLGTALVDSGFCMLEVPLNRPQALQCIEILAAQMPTGVLVGGGTMLSTADVDNVHAAGGRLMVSPNCDPAVIRRARDWDMLCAPGIATPTEAFLALRHGAQVLKLFPAEVIGFAGLKALTSVLPAGTPLWPVGGITPESLQPWQRAGATGFGIGGQLFQPGMAPEALSERAHAFTLAWRQAQQPV